MSRMGISAEQAEELVYEANVRIFGVLQKRAFRRDEGLNSNSTVAVENEGDVEHKEVLKTMKGEGVHLLDHDDPLGSGGEVNSFESQSSDVTKPWIPESSSRMTGDEARGTEVGDVMPGSTRYPGDSSEGGLDSGSKARMTNQKVVSRNPYQEEISDHDLRGIVGHRINTDILKERHQFSPGTILDDEPYDLSSDSEQEKIKGTKSWIPEPSSRVTEIGKSSTTRMGGGSTAGGGSRVKTIAEGLDKKILTQGLDRKLYGSKVITKGDRVDTSPSETQQVTQDGEFLDHLKKDLEQ